MKIEKTGENSSQRKTVVIKVSELKPCVSFLFTFHKVSVSLPILFGVKAVKDGSQFIQLLALFQFHSERV